MSIMTTDEDGHLESIVFFLSEALRAAIESGNSVQQSLLEAPQFSPNMTCGEIADRLALYRKHLRAVWSYEVLLVAKIMRARELARELRALEPELRPELDTFRLATVSCADLREMLIPNAQNTFNGVDQGPRFANVYSASPSGARSDPLAGYRVAGHTDLHLLLRACADLHFALAATYAFEPLSSGSRVIAEEEPLLLDEAAEDETEDEEAFLLTDFCEIVSDAGKPATPEWHAPYAGDLARPN